MQGFLCAFADLDINFQTVSNLGGGHDSGGQKCLLGSVAL